MVSFDAIEIMRRDPDLNAPLRTLIDHGREYYEQGQLMTGATPIVYAEHYASQRRLSSLVITDGGVYTTLSIDRLTVEAERCLSMFLEGNGRPLLFQLFGVDVPANVGQLANTALRVWHRREFVDAPNVQGVVSLLSANSAMWLSTQNCYDCTSKAHLCFPDDPGKNGAPCSCKYGFLTRTADSCCDDGFEL